MDKETNLYPQMVEVKKDKRSRSYLTCCQVLFNLLALIIITMTIFFYFKEMHMRRQEEDEDMRITEIEMKMEDCVVFHNCPDKFAQVCGTDGLTYDSPCQLRVTACQFPEMKLNVVSRGACPNINTVTLVGGNSSNEGNVYGRNPSSGKFGPVCDDSWSLYGANVVCKQLGFLGALKFSYDSYFGLVTPRFSYYDAKCKGFENSLDNCRHNDEGDCTTYEGAGVVCDDGTTTTTRLNPKTNPTQKHLPTWSQTWTEQTTSSSSTNTYPISTHEDFTPTLIVNHTVTLVGGVSSHEGNVFATNPRTGVYGPVCDDGWDINDATVLCKFLGFPSAQSFTSNSFYGSVPNQFSYDNVDCNGIEASLDECGHLDVEDCNESEGAGVVCNLESFVLQSNLTVQLVGGSSNHEGNVFAINSNTGVYGPVCDDGWNLNDATVVCKLLGFPSAQSYTSNSFYGSVPSLFSYDNVYCNGNEASLDECVHLDIDDCNESEGAGVICNTENDVLRENFRVELVNGLNPNEGNIFARNPRSGIYGPVCDDHWTLNEANVVCKSLGYSKAVKATRNSFFGAVYFYHYSNNGFSYSSVFCNGTENLMYDCNHNDNDNCSINNGAGVVCYSEQPGSNNTVKLVGGWEYAGDVYALNPTTGIYGPVCDSAWDYNSSLVVCRQLGFYDVDMVLKGSNFGLVFSNFSYTDVECDGKEKRLDDCEQGNNNQNNCNQNTGAGVICKLNCFEWYIEYGWTNVNSTCGIQSVNECQKLCQDNPSCFFFSYNHWNSCCDQKSDEQGSKYSNYAFVSGPKICPTPGGG